MLRSELAKLKARYKAFTPQTPKSAKQQLRDELKAVMKQLAAVKEFQKKAVDAISGKSVTVNPELIKQAVAETEAQGQKAAAAANVNAVEDTAAVSEKSTEGTVTPTTAPESVVQGKTEAAEKAESEAQSNISTSAGEIEVDYGDEDEEEASEPTNDEEKASTADSNANSAVDESKPPTKGDDATTSEESQPEPEGAAKLLSLTSRLQGIMQQQGVKIRTADPNAPKKWTRADIKNVRDFV